MALRHAHAPHVDRDRALGCAGAKYEFGGAAAQVHNEVRGGMILDGARRPGKGKFRFLGSSEHLGFDSEAVFNSGHEILTIRGVAGGGGGCETDAFYGVFFADFGVSFRDFERALKCFGPKLSGFVDALAQAHDFHAARDLIGGLGAGFDVGDQEADGVSSAINCCYAHRHSSKDQWGRRSSTARSPRGLTPGPTASACATKTCRHFTRVGMPPAEIPAISGTSPSTARSAR